jgi:mono/diheme cytochrome c family protein
MRRSWVLLAGAAGLAAVYWATRDSDSASLSSEVAVPELSEPGTRGQAAFNTYCSACHGSDAGGTNSGPPLIHKIYHPGHHGDMAFLLAARQGSRAHHWSFGDMPPVPGVSDAELADIIAFVREVQHANGIF